MNILGIIINAIVSASVGLALWTFLPRGVVLTRQRHSGGAWRIRNDSPIPILILSVTVGGVSTYNEDTRHFYSVPLGPVGNENPVGATLNYDDECEYITMHDWNKSWEGETISPGNTLTATVPNNSTLTIRYRRARRGGTFERRTLRIDGGV